MRVLIIGDMEGVCGINHWDQVQAGGYLYEEGRNLYTGEINAAAQGALKAGAERIVYIDGHGAGHREDSCKFNSCRFEQFDPAIEFVTHHRYLDYGEILREGFDAAFFIGIHAREGTPGGVLSHTISTSIWRNIYFNDTVVGEIGVMSALVGSYGIPMVYIAGDEAACDEARALLGKDLTTCAVKKGLSRFSALHQPIQVARQNIRDGAAEALGKLENAKPYIPGKPLTIRYDIQTVDKIDGMFRGKPGLEIDDEALSVSTTSEDFQDAWWKIFPL